MCLAVRENQRSYCSNKSFFFWPLPFSCDQENAELCSLGWYLWGTLTPSTLLSSSGCGSYSYRHKVAAASPSIMSVNASWSLPFISGQHSSSRTFVCMSLAWTESPLLIRESGESKDFSWADCYPEQKRDSFSSKERGWLLERQPTVPFSLCDFSSSNLNEVEIRGHHNSVMEPSILFSVPHIPYLIPIRWYEHIWPNITHTNLKHQSESGPPNWHCCFGDWIMKMTLDGFSKASCLSLSKCGPF